MKLKSIPKSDGVPVYIDPEKTVEVDMGSEYSRGIDAAIAAMYVELGWRGKKRDELNDIEMCIRLMTSG